MDVKQDKTSTLANIAKVIFLQIILLGGSAAYGQETDIDNYQKTVGDYSPLYVGQLETEFNRTDWVNDPFWNDNAGNQGELKSGELSVDGRIYKNVNMRMNIVTQELTIVSSGKKIAVVPNMDHVDYWIIDGKKYKYVDGVICRLEYEGENISLGYNKKKINGTDIINVRKVLHTYAEKDGYYLISDGKAYQISREKQLMRMYPEYKKEIKGSINRNTNRQSTKRDKLTAGVSELDNLVTAKRIGTKAFLTELKKSEALSKTDLPKDFELKTEMVALDTHKHRNWEYTDDEDYDSETPGVGDFEQLKEDKILEEVYVRGLQGKVKNVHVGMEKFRPSLLKNIPLALGEADIMKMIQTLPGIKSVGEASSGYNVRGGSSDQNLILFNNATIYNPMHLFGLFSAFNSDMVNDAELYKSSVPAQYGGRMSSVLNITPKIADKNKWHGQATISPVTSKMSLEMPLVKEKVSLLLSGRITYSDWLLGLLPEKSGYKNGKAGFYDFGATLSVTLTNTSRVNAYGYYSHDRFSFNSHSKYGYTNRNYSVDWRGSVNDNITAFATAGADHYDYFNDDTEVPSTSARLSFSIDQYFIRGIFTHILTPKHTLKYGINTMLYDIMPGKYEGLGEKSTVEPSTLPQDNALESAIFAEDEWRPFSELTVNGGIRLQMFNGMTDNREKSFVAPEIRLSANYNISQNQSVKFGFNTMHQYIHKISNTVIMSPTDTWKLSDEHIKPQSGWQVAAGYVAKNDQVEFSTELYYKRMKNYLTFKSSGVIFMNSHIETDVFGAEGKAYGVEVQLRKQTGKINGWISYGYSRTMLRQPGDDSPINDGDWFAADHDRPHEVKVVSNFKLTHRYSFSCNVDYSTGRPITVPAGRFYDSALEKWQLFYTKRNSQRMPDFFRMDLSFNIEPNHKLTQATHSNLSLGVYNVLGRRNAYSIYYQVEGYSAIPQGYKLSIFGAPIPFISYSIKF